ncbi:MAG: L,D-transpeptidase family protein [Verrucomicrobiota bacterium]
MSASSRLPLVVRLVFSSVLITLGVSCVNTNPYYSAASPGGGYYVTMAPPRWEFAPLGLVKRSKATPPSPYKGDGSFWKGDDVEGKPRIHIKIEEQMALYYKGDKLVGASPVCTGSDEFPTPRGNFSVIQKDEDHVSSIYGNYVDADMAIMKSNIDNRKDARPPGTKFDAAKMHYFMRVTGAVGMHEGYLPGYADSHGCIRLPTHMAKIFFENTPGGTPVKITN